MFMIASSGVMFSEESKQGLLGHNPTMMIIDAFSSSEAVGMGQSVSTAGGASTTAKFMLGENTKVITEDGHAVEPGSGEIGRVAVGGFQPIGYYKDPEKTAATFITVRGQALLVPRRLRPGRGRRLAHPPRPGFGVHQHRRREGLPRGGRGGPQDPPVGARRRRRRRARREVRRGDHRRGRADARASSIDAGDVIAHVKGEAGVVQGAQARAHGRHHRPGPQRQGRLQAAQGLRHRSAHGLIGVALSRAAGS